LTINPGGIAGVLIFQVCNATYSIQIMTFVYCKYLTFEIRYRIVFFLMARIP